MLLLITVALTMENNSVTFHFFSVFPILLSTHNKNPKINDILVTVSPSIVKHESFWQHTNECTGIMSGVESVTF